MRVPHRVVGRTRPASTPLQLVRPASPVSDGGIAQAGQQFARAAFDQASFLQQRKEQTERFTALSKFNDFQMAAQERMVQLQREAPANGLGFTDTVKNEYTKLRQEFLASIPPNLFEEFDYRAGQVEGRLMGAATEFQLAQQDAYSLLELDKHYNQAKFVVAESPDAIEAEQTRLAELLLESGLPAIERMAKAREMNAGLQAVAYGRVLENKIQGELEQTGGWVGALKARESSGNPEAMNEWGYAGLYQFGAPRLADLGAYIPGPDEDLEGWSKRKRFSAGDTKWSGTFNIPGHPDVKTIDDFLASPAAQESVFKLHRAKMDQEIEQLGLDEYIGKEVGGVPVTRDGLYASMHLAGASGTRRMLEGGEPPKDANGTSALDYLGLGAQVEGEVENDGRFAELDFKVREAIKAKAAKTALDAVKLREKARDAQLASARNELYVALHDGNAAEPEIAAARRAGILTDINDIEKAENILKGREEELAGRALIQTMLDTGQPYNPVMDNDDFNKWFGREGDAALAARDMDFVNTQLLPVVQKFNDVPTRVVGLLDNMSRSQNLEDITFAFETLMELEDRAPEAFAHRVPNAVADRVDTYRYGRDALTTEGSRDEFFAYLRGGRTPQQVQAQRALDAEAQELLKEKNVGGKLRTATDLGPWIPWTAGDLAKSPEIQVQMEREFAAAFRQSYRDTRDNIKAEEAALRKMARVWGVTTLGGPGRNLMKFPPESVYPPMADGDLLTELADFITGGTNAEYAYYDMQARNDLRLSEDEDYQLIGDEQTAQEVEAWKAKRLDRLPSYSVVKFLDDGTKVTLPTRWFGALPETE